MENDLILPNVNYLSARIGVDALEKGRLKVVTEATSFKDHGSLVGNV